MIIDCIADLHGHYPKLEGGDLLIVAGDLTKRDEADEYVEDFQEWLNGQDYRCKIVIAGNHDNLLRKGIPFFKYNDKKMNSISAGVLLPINNCIYLCDSGTEFEGLKIWGSPWTLTFPGINPTCTAFTGTDAEIADKMEKIPHDTDILITHGPAHLVLDKTSRGSHAGSGYLHGWLKYCGRPKLHVHGHIHEAYGQEEFFYGCQSINCSHVNERYQPVNAPVRILL